MRGHRSRNIARVAERQNRAWVGRRKRKKTRDGDRPLGPVLHRTRSRRRRGEGVTDWIVAFVILAVVALVYSRVLSW